MMLGWIFFLPVSLYNQTGDIVRGIID